MYQSSDVLLQNIGKLLEESSLRKMAKKLLFSESILLNWSSGRSVPSLEQIDQIAFSLNINPSLLISENIQKSLSTDLYEEGVCETFIENIDALRLEKGISINYFYECSEKQIPISYRNFREYTSGKKKIVNTKAIDVMSNIYGIDPYKLLEKRKGGELDEKKN